MTQNMFTAEKNLKIPVDNPNNQPPTLFEFKINDNIIKIPQNNQNTQNNIQRDPLQQLLDKNIYPQDYINTNNPLQGPYSNANIYPTIVKRYNISISNPNGDYVKLHDLYEDILPQVKGIIQKTLTTIEERLVIHQYLRSIFIRYNDGEDIILDGNGYTGKSELTNLLSHIKVMEINPYHFSRLTNNPYATLADGFILFRSCYPVRMNIQINTIQCANDNIGIHIRIYQMKVFDILVDKYQSMLKKHSDLWREISFYEYIKEKIIKKKVCPNFIMVYSWYVTKKTGINFVKMSQFKKDRTYYPYYTINNNLIQMRRNANLFAFLLNKNTNIYNYAPNKFIRDILIINDINNLFTHSIITNENNIITMNRRLNTNKCVVMITEAPTQNIFDWATKTYTLNNGPIKRMIQSGFHTDNVWKSILFQILVIFIVLINNNISINESSLENNFYIKDLRSDETNIGFWKYKIFGITFYIPNYGYLVVFDSKYHDLKNGNRYLDIYLTGNLNFFHKIYAKFIDNPEDTIEKVYYDKLKEINDDNANNIFDSDKFKIGFTMYGGIPPNNDIMQLINNMRNDVTNVKFRKDEDIFKDLVCELFINNYSNFLHNKIGKVLKDVDMPNINTMTSSDMHNLRSGDYVTIFISGKYKLAIIYIQSDNTPKIICSDVQSVSYFDSIENNTIKIQDIPISELHELIWFIDQEFIPYYNTAENNILETYTII